VKKLNVMAAVVAALMLPVALGPAAAADADVRIPGEKLDSGLGTMIYGESLDSGLGELPASYDAREYMPQGWVRGESMDSGLGELAADYTAAEFMPRIVSAAQGQ
jgi:hypothetical protein